MALGKRIKHRLDELGWERKDLLAKVPNLSPAALSSLIRRDSKRSEFDLAIADALGMSVMELVYDEKPAYSHQNVIPLTAREPEKFSGALADLVAIAETMSERGVCELVGQARLLAGLHPKPKANHSS